MSMDLLRVNDRNSRTELDPKNGVPDNFIEKYKFEKSYPFVINSFESIRWSDPFPEEKLVEEEGFKVPYEITDLVYPE